VVVVVEARFGLVGRIELGPPDGLLRLLGLTVLLLVLAAPVVVGAAVVVTSAFAVVVG